MPTDKAEPLTIEAEIVEEDESLAIQARMSAMQEYKTKPRPKSKKAIRINISETCNRMGFDPVEALINFARNDPAALGQTQPIAPNTQLAAITTLVNQGTPGYKPIDYVDTGVKQVAPLPIFAPKRGVEENKSASSLEDLGEEDEGS